jgi:hypothetical protein
MNRYLYANANPVMFTDPTGFMSDGTVAGVINTTSIMGTLNNMARVSYGVGLVVWQSKAFEVIVIYSFMATLSVFLATLELPLTGAGVSNGILDTVLDQVLSSSQSSGSSSSISFDLGGTSPGNPDPNKHGMNNKRILHEVKIRGYRISMDLERGGSGVINIHLKVGDTKYYFDFASKQFISATGGALPNKLQDLSMIGKALDKAINLMQGGW